MIPDPLKGMRVSISTVQKFWCVQVFLKVDQGVILDKKTSEKSIEEKYDSAFSNTVSINPVWSHQAKMEMISLIEEEFRSGKNISDILKRGNSSQQLGGFAAEEFHATTYNMDAILKGKTARAETGMDKSLIPNNDSVSDIVIGDHGEIVQRVQSKYNYNAETTANQHSVLDKDTLRPKYEQADVALSPSDQLEAVREVAKAGATRHRTKAEGLAEHGGQPDVIEAHQAKAEAYEKTSQKADSTIKHDGASSKPLSKSEADAMGDGDLSTLEKLREGYKNSSTLQNMGKAATGAAAMSAVVAGSVNIVNYVAQVRAGRLSPEEATIKIAAETVAAAADSAVKAAATSGAQSLIVRYGSKELARTMAKNSMGTLLRSNAVSVAVVCTIDLVKDLVLFGAGKLTADQLQERSGKNLLTTSAGAVGGSLGVVAGGSLAALAGGLAVPLLPVIGGFAGALICSKAMELAVEAGIEAPYRELVSNTQTLQESAALLQEVTRKFSRGQVSFERFLIVDAGMESDFALKMKGAASETAAMRSAIDRI